MTGITSRQAALLVTAQNKKLVDLKAQLDSYKNETADRKTLHHHNNRIARIRQMHSEFMANNEKIVQSELDNDDAYFKDNLYNQFENEFIQVLSTIEIACDALFPPPPVNSNTNTATTCQAAVSATPATVTIVKAPVPFKMPTFEILPFTGIYTEWPQFYDQFLQVHSNTDVSINHKFHILKNALSSKVKTLIGHLDITSENYQTAFDALVERYNNKRVLFSNYMEQFLNQPVISNESAEQLSTLYDISRSTIFSLKKLGIKTDDCGEMLAHILLKKLPHITRLEWEKELGKDKAIPKFDRLIEFVHLCYRTLESIYPQTATTENKPPIQTTSKEKGSSQNPYKYNARKETKSFHFSTKNVSCPLCPNMPHSIRKCIKFLRLAPFERKTEADKHSINCLGHKQSQQCTSTNTCKICSSKHHTLLHFNQSFAPASSQQQTVSNLVSASHAQQLSFVPVSQSYPVSTIPSANSNTISAPHEFN